nr:potassium transporter TrkG [Dissulfurirhabdus thermomarina]
MDLRAVGHHLAAVLRLLGLLLAVPAAVAAAGGEWEPAARFALLAAGTWGAGFLGGRGHGPDLPLREALVVTALAYVAAGLAGALAFVPAAGFWDALFEAVSGFTTTGLGILDPGALPRSLLFFRSYAQWVGGAGIIVLSVVLLFGPGQAAFRLYGAEFGGENLVGSVRATGRVVLGAYVLLTAGCCLLYLGLGMSPLDAVLHAFSTISTGGFSPAREGLSGAGPGLSAAVTAAMFLGAVSFPLYHRVRTKGLRAAARDVELRWMAGIAAAATAAFLALGAPGLHAAAFRAVSALSTTGFALSDPAAWAPPEKTLATILMLVGGSTGSTAGGIKILRLVLALRVVSWGMKRLLLPPEAKVPLAIGGVQFSETDIRSAFGFLALYALIFTASTLVLTLWGFPAGDAAFESASALGTVGLSAGVTGPGLPLPAKALLIFDMLAGRLEILPLLVLLAPWHWRPRRRPGRTRP